jgi:hypothetical protein
VPGIKDSGGGNPEGVRSKWFVMEMQGEELERTGRFIEKQMLRATVGSVRKFRSV